MPADVLLSSLDSSLEMSAENGSVANGECKCWDAATNAISDDRCESRMIYDHIHTYAHGKPPSCGSFFIEQKNDFDENHKIKTQQRKKSFQWLRSRVFLCCNCDCNE